MSLSGGTRGDYERILKEVHAKVLAVDLSVWLMEVKSLPKLRQSFPTEMAAFLKVIFDKVAICKHDRCVFLSVQVTNMIRMGCVPVIVLEGEVDESKFQLMEKR